MSSGFCCSRDVKILCAILTGVGVSITTRPDGINALGTPQKNVLIHYPAAIQNVSIANAILNWAANAFTPRQKIDSLC